MAINSIQGTTVWSMLVEKDSGNATILNGVGFTIFGACIPSNLDK